MEDYDEGPRDEYLHYYTASKAESHKIMQSAQFEEVVAKFWHLLRDMDECDTTRNVVNHTQYTMMMKRVYMVLLPLYRESEMDKEIEEEWAHDSQGQTELNYQLFTKLLFRIAHHWSTNVDHHEYAELLDKIFARITMRKVIKASDGSSVICYPTIQVGVIPEAGFDGEDQYQMAALDSENALLEACDTDDEEEEGYEYVYTEDPETKTLIKNKKRNAPKLDDKEDLSDAIPLFNMKDAVLYEENVVYHLNNGDYRPRRNDLVSFVLADMKCVVPFGYPTEQFFTWIKNNVVERLEDAKQARKEALAKMKREAL
jgi:hypothetical protein